MPLCSEAGHVIEFRAYDSVMLHPSKMRSMTCAVAGRGCLPTAASDNEVECNEGGHVGAGSAHTHA
jgi:hypothetical protein